MTGHTSHVITYKTSHSLTKEMFQLHIYSLHVYNVHCRLCMTVRFSLRLCLYLITLDVDIAVFYAHTTAQQIPGHFLAFSNSFYKNILSINHSVFTPSSPLFIVGKIEKLLMIDWPKGDVQNLELTVKLS